MRRKLIPTLLLCGGLMFSAGASASMTNYTTPVNEPSNGISITDTAGTISYHQNTQSIATPSQFQSYTDDNPSGIADAAAGGAMSSASDENAESKSMGNNTGVAGAPPESSSAGGTGNTYAYGFIVCGNGSAEEGTALDGYQISCIEDGTSSSGAQQVSVSACNTENGTNCGNTPAVITAADASSAPNSSVTNDSGWGAFSGALASGSTYALSGGGTLTMGSCVPDAIHTCSGTQCAGVTYVNDTGNTVTCNSSNNDCDTFELPNPAYPIGDAVTCSAEISETKTFSSQNLYNLSNRGESSEEGELENSNSYVSDTVGGGVADNSGTTIFQGTTSNSAQLATDILNNDGMQTCTDNQVNQMSSNQGYVVTCNGQSEVPVAGTSSTSSCSTGYTCNDFTTTNHTTTVSCDENVGFSQAYEELTDPIQDCTSGLDNSNCGYGECSNIDGIPDVYDKTETWQCPTCTPYYTYTDSIQWGLTAPQICNSYAWSGTNQMSVSTSAQGSGYASAINYDTSTNVFSGATNITGAEEVGCVSGGNSGVSGSGDELCPDSQSDGATNNAATGSCITLAQDTGDWSGGPITVESEPKQTANGGYVQQNMVFTPDGNDINITDNQTTATCTYHHNCTTTNESVTTCQEENVQTGQSCTTNTVCTTNQDCTTTTNQVLTGYTCPATGNYGSQFTFRSTFCRGYGPQQYGYSTTIPANECPNGETPDCVYRFGQYQLEIEASNPQYTQEQSTTCTPVQTCNPVTTCTPTYTEENVCTTTTQPVTTCNPYTSCVTSYQNYGQIGQVVATMTRHQHYTCTDSSSNPTQSKNYTYSTCNGFTTLTRQTGSVGTTPSSPAEAESGDYGEASTNMCTGYTNSSSGAPTPTCPDTGVAYNVQQSAKFVETYEDYVACFGEAPGSWGCDVSANTANAPSSCPSPMSTTSNQSPVAQCSFGSLQDSTSAGGDYFGTCSGADNPNGAFAHDILEDSSCSVAKTVCTDTQDGYCIQPWTFYACYGALSACPNT